MRVALFCHSLLSDWNHGNAHFLRGVVTELQSRGWGVRVFEPEGAWSLCNLLREEGWEPLRRLRTVYPQLPVERYDPARLDLDQALEEADVVLVHEWNDPQLVARIGRHRARSRRYQLFFHDTHHRSVTRPDQMGAYDLRDYDGVLAFGSVVRDLYRERGWAARAWTWHEAADVRVFRPMPDEPRRGDLVWIGNWGDGERTRELREFLMKPVAANRLRAVVHGVRYPITGRALLRAHGIRYGGWLANPDVPRTFARFRATVHVPRAPYARALPGIPTIRPFEALACGIPLVSAPWQDSEGLFRPGVDFLVARDGAEMRRHLRDLMHDPALASALSEAGRQRVLARHTCAHRVDELRAIASEQGLGAAVAGDAA